jgi:hypothetical protein
LLRFHMNGTSELKYRCYSVILSGGTGNFYHQV